MKYRHTIVLKVTTAFLSLFFIMQVAFAGMTISGTRIIFPANEREYTVRTNNRGNTPLLVQVWVDDGRTDADINNYKVPFTVTPPVYRVEPGKGQSVRLIYNGMNLPEDRESVFWFNMLEIPPVDESAVKTDRLELAFRTRVKIFYRPVTLKSTGLQQIDQFKWAVISTDKGIRVTNPTPYHLSLDSAYISSGSTKTALTNDMIPPFSTKELRLAPKALRPATINSVTLRVINDYGSVIECHLEPAGGNNLVLKKENK